MSYSKDTKQQAIDLRMGGHSYHEIASALHVPQGTIYAWTHAISLSENAIQRIQNQRQLGHQKAKQHHQRQQQDILDADIASTSDTMRAINLNAAVLQALLAVFICSSNAQPTKITYSSSDPNQIKHCLTLLRHAYEIDMAKIKVQLFIHESQDSYQILEYWSKHLNLPLTSFNRCHISSTTTQKNPLTYGSCRLTYSDTRLARRLTALYNALIKNLGS